METTYPNCILCGKEWSSLPEDLTTFWCSSHYTLWGYLNQDGSYSFDLEMWDSGEPSFDIRWNCNCMVEECFGKNVVLNMDDDNCSIIKMFDPPLPYTITRQELIELLKEAT